MRFYKRYKKGAVESYFVVTVVLAIVGFIAVLFFAVNKTGFQDYGNDEVCKLSVLTRATTPANAQSYVPLKCSTKKTCLTQDKECGQFAGEDKVVREKLPDDRDAAARKIEEIHAKAMYDCWNMMGQGKLDLFGSFAERFGGDSAKPTCVICSRVAIDKNVPIEVLQKVDINRYMENTPVSEGGLTYLQALANDKGARSFVRLKTPDEIARLEKDPNLDSKKLDDIKSDFERLVNEQANKREMAFVFMQIKTEKFSNVLANLGVAGIAFAGGAFMTPVMNKVLFNPYVIGGSLIIGGAYATYAYSNIHEGQELAASAGYCGDFVSSKGDAEKGCSITQMIPYDYQYINKLCNSIQGNP